MILNKETEKFSSELHQLDTKLKDLLKTIGGALDTEGKSKTIAVNQKKIKQLLPQLEEALIKKNPKTRMIIKELEEAGLHNKEFDVLKSAVSKYDFKGALQLLDKFPM